jgi:hypothetical protein
MDRRWPSCAHQSRPSFTACQAGQLVDLLCRSADESSRGPIPPNRPASRTREGIVDGPPIVDPGEREASLVKVGLDPLSQAGLAHLKPFVECDGETRLKGGQEPGILPVHKLDLDLAVHRFLRRTVLVVG